MARSDSVTRAARRRRDVVGTVLACGCACGCASDHPHPHSHPAPSDHLRGLGRIHLGARPMDHANALAAASTHEPLRLRLLER
jgi:hypothetical protein